MFINRGDKLDAYPFKVPGSRHPRALTQDEKRKFADQWLKDLYETFPTDQRRVLDECHEREREFLRGGGATRGSDSLVERGAARPGDQSGPPHQKKEKAK